MMTLSLLAKFLPHQFQAPALLQIGNAEIEALAQVQERQLRWIIGGFLMILVLFTILLSALN